MGQVIELNETNFEDEVVQSAEPVLVDFWATWCGPCRQLLPVVEELATENAGSAKVCKVNVDENQRLSMKYQVEALPTLMVFKGGQVVQKFVGAQGKARLQEAIDEAKS